MSMPIASLGKPGPMASADEKINWLMNMMDQLTSASQGSIDTIADSYNVADDGGVPTRVLVPSTATVTDVANVLATLLRDLHKRGVNGGPG
jgi:hypothetical protein